MITWPEQREKKKDDIWQKEQLFLTSLFSCYISRHPHGVSKIPITGTFIRTVQRSWFCKALQPEPGSQTGQISKVFLWGRLWRCCHWRSRTSISGSLLLKSHFFFYWSSSYLWRASSSLAVIFWKKLICWRRWCCICERKSRTRVRWKCWISASVAQEIMLQRSWRSLSRCGQSLTLVNAPGKKKRRKQ